MRIILVQLLICGQNLQCKIFATPFTAVLIREKFREKQIDITNDLQIVELNGKVSLDPI